MPSTPRKTRTRAPPHGPYPYGAESWLGYQGFGRARRCAEQWLFSTPSSMGLVCRIKVPRAIGPWKVAAQVAPRRNGTWAVTGISFAQSSLKLVQPSRSQEEKLLCMFLKRLQYVQHRGSQPWKRHWLDTAKTVCCTVLSWQCKSSADCNPRAVCGRRSLEFARLGYLLYTRVVALRWVACIIVDVMPM